MLLRPLALLLLLAFGLRFGGYYRPRLFLLAFLLRFGGYYSPRHFPLAFGLRFGGYYRPRAVLCVSAARAAACCVASLA